MATIKEVAELANVSVPTVYKVFDENYTTTDEIRKRVLKASKELDYRPRKNRKTYRDGKTVAIIYNEFINSFNNYITRGVSNELERYGYRLVVLHDDEIIAQDDKNVKQIQAMGADALIFTPVSDEKQEAILELAEKKFPMIQLFQTAYSNIDTIQFNDELGTYLATSYLLKNGHRKIMLASRTDRSELIRKPGYYRAFEEMGLVVDKRYLYTLNYVNSVKQMVKEKILKEKPTAIIAVSEAMCATVILALRELHLSIPGDVSLISYDDYPWMEAFGITAVSHPFSKVSSIISRLIVDQLTKSSSDEWIPSSFMIDPSLKVRDSVKMIYSFRQELLPHTAGYRYCLRSVPGYLRIY